MHEFSLVKREVEKLQKKVGNRDVKKVVFFLGRLAHGTPNSIREAFKIAVFNTPLSNTKLDVKTIEPKAKCSSCGKIFRIQKNMNFSCDRCGSKLSDLISGNECYIDKVEVEN